MAAISQFYMGTLSWQAGQWPLDQTIQDRVMVAPNMSDQRSSADRAIQGVAASTRSSLTRATQGSRATLARTRETT